MLVLTRRLDQKVIFPNLDVTIDVLRLKGNVVKLGIDAPPQVKILRHEIFTERLARGEEQPAAFGFSETLNLHDLANTLNTTQLSTQLLQKKVQQGDISPNEVEARLEAIVESFSAVEAEMARLRGRQAEIADEQVSLAAAIPELRKIRALIVDDSSNEAELLAGFLRFFGIDVEIAGDGLQGLEALDTDEAKTDVVLLDMNMPRLSGPELLSRLRQDETHQGLKVFAVSGSDPEELGIAVGPGGVDRWFAKPVNPQNIAAQIAKDFNLALGA